MSNGITVKCLWLSIEQLLNEAKVYISLLLTVSDLKRCARIKK